MTSVIIHGAAGKMGQRLIRLALQTKGFRLAGAIEKKGHPLLGQEISQVMGIGKTSFLFASESDLTLDGGEVLIDFSTPEGTLKAIDVASKYHLPLVIGTTGFSKNQTERIKKFSKKIPCVMAPNMSVGVNVMFKILKDMAKILGKDYDIEIVETHHRHKKDAPSGTAMKMAQIAAETLHRDLSKVATYGRHGLIGERKDKEIGIHSIRAGDIIGEHTGLFAGMGESLEITHRAYSRDNFARGALEAAKWITKKKSGLYDMLDVLELK